MCRSSCTVCKQKASLHCEPACVFSDWQYWCLSSRTGCNCGTSFHHAEACAFWGLWSSWRRDCNEHMRKVRLQLAFPWLIFSKGRGVVWSNLQHSCGITKAGRSCFQNLRDLLKKSESGMIALLKHSSCWRGQPSEMKSPQKGFVVCLSSGKSQLKQLKQRILSLQSYSQHVEPMWKGRYFQRF